MNFLIAETAFVKYILPLLATSTVAYVQDQVDFDRLHLLGGVRQSKIDVTDSYAAMGVNNVSSNNKTTPRVGATYD